MDFLGKPASVIGGSVVGFASDLEPPVDVAHRSDPGRREAACGQGGTMCGLVARKQSRRQVTATNPITMVTVVQSI